MTWFDWFLIAWWIFGAVIFACQVGKPRKPIEPGASAALCRHRRGADFRPACLSGRAVNGVVVLPGPDLAHAAMSLLWYVQREYDDRPEVVR